MEASQPILNFLARFVAGQVAILLRSQKAVNTALAAHSFSSKPFDAFGVKISYTEKRGVLTQPSAQFFVKPYAMTTDRRGSLVLS
jgi:hypothetical protein